MKESYCLIFRGPENEMWTGLVDAILALGKPGRAAIQDFSDVYAMATRVVFSKSLKKPVGL